MAWPQNPPYNTRCDAHTGTGYDDTGKPVVYRCQETAVETCVDRLGFESWLCDKHATMLAEKHLVKRNPQLHSQ